MPAPRWTARLAATLALAAAVTALSAPAASAHPVLLPYCDEIVLPFFGPILNCHTWFGDLQFSRPW